MSLGPRKIKIRILIIIVTHRLDDLNNNTEELSAQQSQLEAAEPLADALDNEQTLNETDQATWDAAETTQNTIEQNTDPSEMERAENEFLQMN